MARFLLSGRASMAAAIAAMSFSALMIGSPVAAADDTAAFHPVSLDRIIADASERFAVPERWIHAAMQAERAGDPSAVS